MTVSFRHLGWSTLATFALVGCEAPVQPPAPTAPTPNSAEVAPADKDKEVVKPMPTDGKPMPTDPADMPKDKGAAVDPSKLTTEEIAEIKKLPADEQTVAMAQLTCPVSDGHLGAMDTPVKEVVDGKTVFLCCGNCEKDFKADPAKYLAKMAKK